MKKLTLPLFFLFIAFLVIPSCKKETKISNNVFSSEEIQFFRLEKQLDTFLEKVVDTIYNQNLKHQFIGDLVQEIGYPLWEQSEVVRATHLIKNVQVIVPFALPAQKEINSFLVCNVYDDDMHFRLIKGASYAGYGFSSQQDSLNAGRVAQILMYFDHKVFGDSLFFVNDSRILNNSAHVASRTELSFTSTVIKITPQPFNPTPIHMIPNTCPNGVTVKYTSVYQEAPDPFGTDPCTIWVTTSSSPAFGTNLPPAGNSGGGSGSASSQPVWNSKPTCMKVIGDKVYFDVPGCTTIPPIQALTDDLILTNRLPLLTTKERAIWDEIYKEEEEANNVFNKDCQGTNRTGNIQWPGTIEHWMIMIDYMAQNPLSGEVEYQIPGAGSLPTIKGYADIVNKLTREIFEIKPDNETGIDLGKKEVDNYVIKANANCPPSMVAATDGGSITPWRKGTNYTRRILPNPKNVTENIVARLHIDGVVVYKSESRITQPVPIVVPQSVRDKIKNLLKKLKEKVNDYETVIATFLRENPEVVTYIKAAAYGAALGIFVGTIIEDFATLGAGIVDDWASFLLAKRIFDFAYRLP